MSLNPILLLLVMGSRFSHERSRSPHQCTASPCLFPVSHVNHDMRTIVRGHLEVSASSLAFLHPENGTTLRLEWPFAVIRNYGCTIDWLFMIEVGRRSSTGEGYFFFKSCHASAISDCLEQHLNAHNELRRQKTASSLLGHMARRRRRCCGSAPVSPVTPSAPPFVEEGAVGGGDCVVEKDAVSDSSSPSDSATSYGASSYARSRSVSDSSERHPHHGAPSGGYVIPVFQHDEDSMDEDEVAHEYMNSGPRRATNYVNAVPPRPERPRRRSSGVEYSTVIADVTAERLLGNDYANLPSLDTLPPLAVGQVHKSYEEL